MKALFRVENDYNQPERDFVCIWKNNPTIEELAKSINQEFPASNDDMTLNIVKLWHGENVRINGTDFFIEEIQFNKSYF